MSEFWPNTLTNNACNVDAAGGPGLEFAMTTMGSNAREKERKM